MKIPFKKTSFSIKNIYTVLLCIIVIAIGIHLTIHPKGKISSKFDKSINFSNGWTDKDNNNITLKTLIKNKSIKQGKTISIYHKLNSNIKPGSSLCFRAHNVLINGYIDDKQIIKTDFKKNVFGCNSTGSKWYFYQIKEEDIGKTIELRIKVFYNDNSASIINMAIGNMGGYIIDQFHSQLLSVLCCLFMFFFSIIFMLYGQYLKKDNTITNDIFTYLGYFSGLLSIWCLIETHILQLLVDCSTILQFISCSILYLMIIPSITLLKNIFQIQNKKVCNILCGLSIFSFLVSHILHFTNILDLHESLPLCHVTMFVCSICIFITTLIERNKKKTTNPTEVNFYKKFLSKLTVITVGVGMSIDIFFYYKGTTTNGLIMKLGLLILIIYCGYISLDQIIKVYSELQHASFVKHLAYHDGLTNAKNRTAFEEKLKELEQNIESHPRMGFAMFDLNDLKYVNDLHGHSEGDVYLVTVTNILKESFTESCELYRIGGDEFAIIIDAPNPEAIYKISKMQLNAQMQNYNNFFNKNYKLSLSSGAAFYNKNNPESIDNILKNADKEMYDDKNSQKKAETIAKSLYKNDES